MRAAGAVWAAWAAWLVLGAPLPAQDQTAAPEGPEAPADAFPEAPGTLIPLGLQDQGVELLLQGAWTLRLQAGGGVSARGLEAPPGDLSPGFVFTQVPDLLLSLWIQERWFAELEYQGGFDKNRWRLGWQAPEDQPGLQRLEAGTFGLPLPAYGGLALGASPPGQPVLGLRDRREGWAQDWQLRYDESRLETRIFLGSESLDEAVLDPADWLRGRLFLAENPPHPGLEVFTRTRGERRRAGPDEAEVDSLGGWILFRAEEGRQLEAEAGGLPVALREARVLYPDPWAGQKGSAPQVWLRRRDTGEQWPLESVLLEGGLLRLVGPPGQESRPLASWLPGLYEDAGRPGPHPFELLAQRRRPEEEADPTDPGRSGRQSFALGPGVLEGSVEVRLDGRLTEAWTFEPQTGLLTLQAPLLPLERLEVRYRRPEAGGGRGLTLGGGFEWRPLPAWRWDGGLRLRWQPFNETPQPGQTPLLGELGSRLSYEEGPWTARLSTLVRSRLDSLSPTLRVFSFDAQDFSVPLSLYNLRPAASGGALPASLEGVPDFPLTESRRIRLSSRAADETAWDKLETLPLRSADWTGPYTAPAGSSLGQALVVEGAFEGGTWAGAQLWLNGGLPAGLGAASRLSLWVRVEGPALPSEARLVLQAGELSEDLDGSGLVRRPQAGTPPWLDLAWPNPARYPLGEDPVGNTPDGALWPRAEGQEGQNRLSQAFAVPAGSAGAWVRLDWTFGPEGGALLSRARGLRLLLVFPEGAAPWQGRLGAAGLSFDGGGWGGEGGMSLSLRPEAEGSPPQPLSQRPEALPAAPAGGTAAAGNTAARLQSSGPGAVGRFQEGLEAPAWSGLRFFLRPSHSAPGLLRLRLRGPGGEHRLEILDLAAEGPLAADQPWRELHWDWIRGEAATEGPWTLQARSEGQLGDLRSWLIEWEGPGELDLWWDEVRLEGPRPRSEASARLELQGRWTYGQVRLGAEAGSEALLGEAEGQIGPEWAQARAGLKVYARAGQTPDLQGRWGLALGPGRTWRFESEFRPDQGRELQLAGLDPLSWTLGHRQAWSGPEDESAWWGHLRGPADWTWFRPQAELRLQESRPSVEYGPGSWTALWAETWSLALPAAAPRGRSWSGQAGLGGSDEALHLSWAGSQAERYPGLAARMQEWRVQGRWPLTGGQIRLGFSRRLRSESPAPTPGTGWNEQTQTWAQALAQDWAYLGRIPGSEGPWSAEPLWTEGQLQSGEARSRAEFAYQRPLASAWTDLLWPGSLTLTGERQELRDSRGTAVSFPWQATLDSRALNLFGRFGAWPLTEFWDTDEWGWSARWQQPGPAWRGQINPVLIRGQSELRPVATLQGQGADWQSWTAELTWQTRWPGVLPFVLPALGRRAEKSGWSALVSGRLHYDTSGWKETGFSSRTEYQAPEGTRLAVWLRTQGVSRFSGPLWGLEFGLEGEWRF